MTATVHLRSQRRAAASLHDHMIAQLPDQRPRWLLEGSLFDHRWKVATDDPAKKRDALQSICHDVVIGPGGERLTASGRERDLVTSKLWTYCQLEPPNGLSANRVASQLGTLHWLMRWRDDRGLYRMADLVNDELFQDWANGQRFGRSGVVDWHPRITTFIQAVEDGSMSLPIRKSDALTNPTVSNREVAAVLGLQSLRALPDCEYARLLDLFAALGGLSPHLADMHELVKSGTPPEPTTRDGLAGELSVWASLWGMRQQAPHDPIGYNPFTRKSPLERAAEFVGDSKGRTKTAPEEQVCFLVDRALRWVFDYAPSLLSALKRITDLGGPRSAGRKHVRRPANRQAVQDVLTTVVFDGPGSPRIHPGSLFLPVDLRPSAARQRAVVSFHEAAFVLLPTACAIVIATFTARRREEIASLQDNCIERDHDGEPWMLTWIEKTLRDLDRIPVPESVVKAVDILVDLSASAREKSGERWLFEFRLPLHDWSRDHHLGPALRRFAEFVDVPRLQDGSRWTFTPHQFRRFFAIVYYHRFRYASLTALSAFLKHYDPEMTRRYITEVTLGSLVKVREMADAAALRVRELAEARASVEDMKAASNESGEIRIAERNMRARQRDFEDARLEAEFSRMWAVACGEEGVGGFGGESRKAELEAMILAARRRVELAAAGTVSEESAFNGLLHDFVESHMFEPHPQGHSYCGCGRSAGDLRTAACLTRKALAKGADAAARSAKPDFAYADARTCSGCLHNIQMAENRRWWEYRLRASLGQAQTALTDHFGHVARADAEMCRGHLGRSFDEARSMAVTLGSKGSGRG